MFRNFFLLASLPYFVLVLSSCAQKPEPIRNELPHQNALARPNALDQIDAPALSSAQNLSNAPQRFVDELLIQNSMNIQRVIQSPKKHEANPLMVQEHPWEKRYLQLYGTVLYEPDLKKFRMWYMASESETAAPESNIAYAESEDGVHWNKPMIGTADFPLYPTHNIVIPGGHGISVIRDDADPDPSRRYKGLGGDLLAFSADGIHWRTQPFEAAEKNDTSSSAIRWKNRYWAYIRNQALQHESIRSFVRQQGFWVRFIRESALSISDDFLRWSPKETVVTTFNDPARYPWTQVYGMAVTPFDGQLIALAWMIDLDITVNNTQVGEQYFKLASSRDGMHWDWAGAGNFMEPSKDAWDSGRFCPSTSMVVKDDLIYIYYSGSNARHGVEFGETGIGLATLPADRFVAVEQKDPNEEAWLQTKPFTSNGGSLILNAEIADGELQTELLDASGKPMPGYSRDESSLEPVDPLRSRVTWNKQSDLPGNQEFSIRFHLNGAKLFAFQFDGASSFEAMPVVPIPQSVAETIDDPLRHGMALFMKSQDEAAIRYLSEAVVDSASKEDALFVRGLAHLKRNRLEEADGDFLRMLELNANNPEAYYGAALSALMAKNHNLAIALLTKAIQFNPEQAKYYAERGYAHTKIGDAENAISDYTKAIELDSVDPFAHEERGKVYKAQEKFSEAHKDFSTAIQRYPNHVWALIDRATLHFEFQQFSDAMEDAKLMLPYISDQANYFIASAYSQLASRQEDAALKEQYQTNALDRLEEAISLNEAYRQSAVNDENLQFLKDNPRFQALLHP